MASLGSTSSNDTTWNGVRLGAHLSSELLNGTRFGSTLSTATFTPGGSVQTATRPTAPSTYTPPAGTSVSTQSGLRSALASGTPATIIVEDGNYSDASGYMTIGAAHQVYGRNLSGATIHNGIQSGSAQNVLFRGLNFNWSDSAQLLSNYGIHMWGSTRGWQFLDCNLTGTDSISAGLAVRANSAYEGLQIKRCTAKNFHDWGFLVDSNSTTYVPSVIPVLQDIYTENCVFKTNPQGSNGVSEAGLWVGAQAAIDRCWFHQDPAYATLGARGELKAWQGLWIGTAFRNSTVNDILVTGSIAFGCYAYGPINADDSTTTFNRMETQFPVNVGWHAEWNNPNAAAHPNVRNVIVQDSQFQSTCVGFHLDSGAVNCTVRRTKFIGQRGAAINNYQSGTPANLSDTTGNDYSQINATATAIRTDYAGNYACWNNDIFSS